MEIDPVRDLLRQFQVGYAQRDQTQLDAFMGLFVAGDDLEIIGTNAVEVGKDEWCLGRAAVRELVSRDWQYWGDVRYDVEGARIAVKGEVAWLSTTGTVTDTITAQDRYTGYLQYVEQVLKEQERSAQARMLDIVRLGTDMTLALPLSETCVWPFRFTAVAVREDGQWRFQQMQFSFATTRAPDVRYVE
jgi:hypothetical protein